ncbi:hypothetical protein [Clostridium sp. Marseille-P2415]|uniref:hypothetical protein n=1 Tax=Clostridium sp. Marseille-P2415 TaxID=1805471 RepID=UPI00190ECCC1|nr:hypothetical protein [Clostridium sp. Marseille-P2415]
MRYISVEATSLWTNIEHIAAIFGNYDASVYQCAHFYEKGSVPSQILSNSR